MLKRFSLTVNCDNWISLREYPDTYSAVLDRIPRGAYVTYLGKAGNGFYHIEYNGRYGYALQVYLSSLMNSLEYLRDACLFAEIVSLKSGECIMPAHRNTPSMFNV